MTTPYIAVSALISALRCQRRLAAHLLDEPPKSSGADPSMRLWTAVVEAIRAAHDQPGVIGDTIDRTAPAHLAIEEQHAFVRALDGYVDAFGDDDTDAHHEAALPKRRLIASALPFELGTRVDLLLQPVDGAPLVRRVHLRGDVVDSHAHDVATAVALGAKGRATNDVVLVVEHLWLAALGQVHRRIVTQADIDRFRTTVYNAVEAVLPPASPAPSPGWWCATCRFTTSCDAIASQPTSSLLLRIGTNQPTRRRSIPVSQSHALDSTLGDPVQPANGLLVLSASRIRDFEACARRYFLRYVLNTPGSDDEPDDDGAARGRAVHAELHARHRDLERHSDAGTVDETSARDPWVLARVRAHLGVCPATAGASTYVDGELDLRWLNRRKNVLLTGRVDAAWLHPDQTLEIRDYKTGRASQSLEHDRASLVYLVLGVAQPLGGARVRVTYEYLADDHAELVSLDATPAAIAEGLDLVESTADRIRVERNFAANPTDSTCRRCVYRSACPTSVARDR